MVMIIQPKMEQERDFIHIQDLIDGHIEAMNKMHDLKNCNYFNLGTGKPISVLELINTFNTVNHLNIKKILLKDEKVMLKSAMQIQRKLLSS